MIEVSHLTKRYGNHTAVDDLSFHIGKGQIYGFLGPNGAGKSTTMNILTGCLAATSGTVRVGGYDIFEQADEAKRLIGYLPELPPVYPDRTPKEYLDFVARAKKVPADCRHAQIAKVMEATGITPVGDRLIKNLSKGYRQRVGIAQALLGDPEIIILDEPTVGLDPRQIIEIRTLIGDLGKDHTVILSSHILSEVQAICQTILIISKGKLVACDTSDNLERVFAGSAAVELTVEASEDEAREILAEVPGISDIGVQADGELVQLKLSSDRDDDTALCREIFFAFSRAGRAIVRMDVARASLEDVFIELTQEEKEAEAE